jgi:transcriptional regulator with XRE-family HTH domain
MGFAMKLGQRIKSLRTQRKQSLQEVATAVSASKAHLSELERGISENPSLDLLQGLAKHFRVTVNYLVGSEPLKDTRAQHFIQKYEVQLSKLGDNELNVLGKLIDTLSGNRD